MIQKIKKVLPGKKKETNNLPTRITNDTVAEHREKVLAGGRKLKYPLQYTKRKLVRNTILIPWRARGVCRARLGSALRLERYERVGLSCYARRSRSGGSD